MNHRGATAARARRPSYRGRSCRRGVPAMTLTGLLVLVTGLASCTSGTATRDGTATAATTTRAPTTTAPTATAGSASGPSEGAPPSSSRPSSTAGASARVTAPDPPLGISIPGNRLLWENDAALAADLDAVVASGATWLRIDVQWSELEEVAGQTHWSRLDRVVDAARARDLKVLGILGTMATWARPAGQNWRYGPSTATDRTRFAQFATAAARRYAGRIDHWEIWNEPNLQGSWAPRADPAAYAALLAATYPAVKSGNRRAVVMTGGTGGVGIAKGVDSVSWYRALYASPARRSFDAVAVHPYTNLHASHTGEMAKAYQIRQVMNEHGDSATLIWGTETGAPTGGDGSVPEARVSGIVADAYAAWHLMPRHGPLFWYTIGDDPRHDGPLGHFGMYRANRTAKPFLATFQAIARGLAPARIEVEAARLSQDSRRSTAVVSLRSSGLTPARQVILAVRDAHGGHHDIAIDRYVGIHGARTLTGHGRVLPRGQYRFWPAYLGPDGRWHDLGPHSSVTL